MPLDQQHYSQRILDVLKKNPKGLTKSALRLAAFNRIPDAINRPWLDALVRQGLVHRKTELTGNPGRPGEKYYLTKRSGRHDQKRTPKT